MTVTSTHLSGRLVRFMIIGLLDVKWETRHGCSLGLMGLLSGLGLGGLPGPDRSPPKASPPSIRISSVDLSSRCDREESLNSSGDDGNGGGDDDAPVRDRLSEDEVSPSPCDESPSPSSSLLSLPQYLVEDIMCTGLCLLMLDRFIDLHSSSSISMSPAKEVSSSHQMQITIVPRIPIHSHSIF